MSPQRAEGVDFRKLPRMHCNRTALTRPSVPDAWACWCWETHSLCVARDKIVTGNQWKGHGLCFCQSQPRRRSLVTCPPGETFEEILYFLKTITWPGFTECFTSQKYSMCSNLPDCSLRQNEDQISSGEELLTAWCFNAAQMSWLVFGVEYVT